MSKHDNGTVKPSGSWHIRLSPVGIRNDLRSRQIAVCQLPLSARGDLQLSAQDLLLGQRRDFSARSQAAITQVLAAEPFDGQCPCCGNAPVLTEAGRSVAGAEFDHVFHRGLNRPEHGWLICPDCHAELTHGGYLVRFMRTAEFRAFQARVLEHRRRAPTRPAGRVAAPNPPTPPAPSPPQGGHPGAP